MHYFHLTLFVWSLNGIASYASIYSVLKENVASLLDGFQQEKRELIPERRDSMSVLHHSKKTDAKDKKAAQNKANILRRIRTHEQNLNVGQDIASSKFAGSQDQIGREYFHMDPVLNELRRRAVAVKRRKGTKDEESSAADTKEQFWKDQWGEHWMQKKFEALDSSLPRGDVVNIAAARPWRVPCGDPNQHDAPGGTCMLPAECDAEFRIYRGDYFCGRTAYICCDLLVTNYDMYQGLDVSFEGSTFEIDSNEKKRGDKKKQSKNSDSEMKKRKNERERRKKNIAYSIHRIVNDIRNILTKAYNGTAQRKKKTRQFKKFLKRIKNKYSKDRKSVMNVHEYELGKIDEKLKSKLDGIQEVNEAYMSNDTFRDIVVNGTVNKEKLRSFLRAHPELAKYFKHRRTSLNLKPGMTLEVESEKEEPESKKENPKVLDYDLEYGMLYY